jgi:DNA-directed RNA polymerase subunit RPC12/RpoP
MKTIYVCGRCGKRAEHGAGTRRWLIARRKGSEGLIIRCESCTTRYALKAAERSGSK